MTTLEEESNVFFLDNSSHGSHAIIIVVTILTYCFIIKRSLPLGRSLSVTQ